MNQNIYYQYTLLYLIILLFILVIYSKNNNLTNQSNNISSSDGGGGCITNKKYYPALKLFDINSLILNPQTIEEEKNNIQICLTFCRITTSIVCGNIINRLKLKYKYGKKYHHIYNKFSKVIGTIVYNDNIILIAWKGSILNNDLIKDLELNLIPLEFPNINIKNKNIKVDKGFFELFNDAIIKTYNNNFGVINFINNIISENNIKYIFSSGHSLGAGISTLSTFLYSHLYNNIKVFNYSSGPPRVGNEEFTKYYNLKWNLKVKLLINLIDLVPNLPPLGTNKYKHVGLNKKNNILVFNGKQDTYLDNHMPPVYYKNIDNAVYLK